MESKEQVQKTVKKSLRDQNQIDPTDPLSELLTYFDKRNSSVKNFLLKNLGKKHGTCFYGHHCYYFNLPLNTFPEDWDGTFQRRYFYKFLYKSTLPIIMTKLRNVNYADPLTERIKRKEEYISHLQKFRWTAKFFNIKKYNDKVSICPSDLIHRAADVYADPDPYFSKMNWNWYYSGSGNMQIMSVDGNDCILHAEFDRLYLSKFSRRKLKIRKVICQYSCGESNCILEVICNENSFVVLRLRSRVVIMKLVKVDEEILFQKLKEVDSELPFTGVTFDPVHTNILYISKIDSTTNIVRLDLMKGKTVQLEKPDDITDNWNRIVPVDENVYVHATTKSISFYDKRTNNMFHKSDNIHDLTTHMDCDDITLVKKCEKIPFMYIGTSHEMFLTDLRYNLNGKMKYLQKWTHLMDFPPTYMSSCKFENDRDLVMVSSQYCDEQWVLANRPENFNRGKYCKNIMVPYFLPTFETTLREANNQKLCVNVYNPINERLYKSIVGNTICQYDDSYLGLSLNVSGDIFAYKLYPDHVENDAKPLERLHDWYMCGRKEKDIEIIDIADMSELLNDLKEVPSDHKIYAMNLIPGGNKFSDKEVAKIFKDSKLDAGLLEMWADDGEALAAPTAMNIDLHFSDSD